MERRQPSSFDSRSCSNARIPAVPAPTANPLYYPEFGNPIVEINGNMTFQTCPHCTRNFTADRIQAHASICQRLRQAPRRPVFDSARQRLAGTDAEPFAKTAKAVQRPISNWRQNHEALIASIRAARRAHAQLSRGISPANLPPPPLVTFYNNFVQCPHCGRRFNESAAEKHISACMKSTQNSLNFIA